MSTLNSALRVLPLFFLVVAGSAGAEQKKLSTEHGRDLVEHFVANVHTMSGRFQQSVDASGRMEETSEGTFRIRRPGQFRWSYTKPYEQILVADGRNLWSYDVDLAQVTVKSQSKALGSTPALLLGGADDALEDFDVLESFEDRGTDWVRLAPRNPESSFTSVELGFTDGNLTRMLFTDDLDQTTIVALFDVELNTEIEPSEFEFSPPDGVDVVGNPVTSPGEAGMPPAAD